MEIASWNSGHLTEEQARRLSDLILRTNGPIVMPIEARGIKSLKAEARKLKLHEIQEMASGNGTLMEGIARLAIKQGKEILPFHTAETLEISRKALRAAEAGMHHIPDSADPQEFMRNAIHEGQAKVMLNRFEAYRKNPPALLIAEDNNAIIFGKLFKKPLIMITEHSEGVERIAQHTMEKIDERLRTSEPGNPSLQTRRRRPPRHRGR